MYSIEMQQATSTKAVKRYIKMQQSCATSFLESVESVWSVETDEGCALYAHLSRLSISWSRRLVAHFFVSQSEWSEVKSSEV